MSKCCDEEGELAAEETALGDDDGRGDAGRLVWTLLIGCGVVACLRVVLFGAALLGDDVGRGLVGPVLSLAACRARFVLLLCGFDLIRDFMYTSFDPESSVSRLHLRHV